ncbi:metallophosphoesterase [Spirochaeta cellobiosiphila]|uniref:metallophosphoesterase n=1 Tax=Spirochaeta cellobiosiphila TaxID=504483 RepID=UPI0004175A9E|nr:metallophosphoesterase [Spirochaeta cellobiosiphila]
MFLRKILFLLLVLPLLLMSCGNKEKFNLNQTSLFVVSDIHYLADKLHDEGSLYTELVEEGDGKNMYVQAPLLAALKSTIERDKPKVLLVTGDLTFNGAKRSHKDLADYFKEVEEGGTQVYVIPGNHDINNPRALTFYKDKAFPSKSITPYDFKKIYKDFGYKGALSYDKDSLSYLIEPIEGIQVLMVDSNKYSNNKVLGNPVQGGFIRPSTLAWMGDLVAKAHGDNKQIFVAMHHSLIKHNPMVSEGFTIDDSDKLQEQFLDWNIPMVLTGHIHIQDIIQKSLGDRKIYDVATNALSVYPHQYGRISFGPSAWHYEAHPVDVETWAKENDIEDDQLRNFPQYSRDFFIKLSNLMVDKSVNTDAIDEETLEEIKKWTGESNADFFAGREGETPIDIPGIDEKARSWINPFLENYLDSIKEDGTPPDNDLYIELNL